MGIDFCSFTSQVDLVGFVRCVKVLFRVKGGGGRLFFQGRWNQGDRGAFAPPHLSISAGLEENPVCFINIYYGLPFQIFKPSTGSEGQEGVSCWS